MMTSQNIAGLGDSIRAAIQLHWKAFLIEGIVLVVLGLAAIIVPSIASVAITIFVGTLFLISGAVGLARDLEGSDGGSRGRRQRRLLPAHRARVRVQHLASGPAVCENPYTAERRGRHRTEHR